MAAGHWRGPLTSWWPGRRGRTGVGTGLGTEHGLQGHSSRDLHLQPGWPPAVPPPAGDQAFSLSLGTFQTQAGSSAHAKM